MKTSKLNRRQFLKLSGAVGVVAAPTLLGYVLLRDAQGEAPCSISPYATIDNPIRSPSPSPILLLINERADNPFGLYWAEILRAEGLNCFQVARLSAVGSAALEQFALVLLAEGTLGKSQVELLENYVARGGRLVAMRPDVRLASLCGLEPVAGTTAEGHMQVDVAHPLGQGIVTEALQIHGVADHYRLAGAQTVAWLTNSARARTGFPAVTVHRYGQGQAATWAFDLARCVAYIRQGNPAWANQERDGRPGIRAHDAFVGWIDLDRIAIPQADEHMRLLGQLMSEMLADVLPLPRLWYFPGAAETMLVATGDSHANPAYAIEDVLTRVERYGGHMSIYYTPPDTGAIRRAARKLRWRAADLPLVGGWVANPTGFPSPSDVADWRSRGHEFGLHPYVEEGIDDGYRRYWREFTSLGYGPVPPTVRTHRVLWNGWAETARVQAGYGLRLNLDYYHIGPAFRDEAEEWMYGYFTGSGLPIRFVDEQGKILNIYQQLTQLVDEHLLEMPWVTNVGLSAEEAVKVSRMLLRRSLDGAYSAIVAQFHVDPFVFGGEYAIRSGRWLEGTLDYAATQGIPIWSAAEWLQFTEVRHNAVLKDVQWNPVARRLSFHLAAQTAPDVALTVMVPLRHGETELAQVEIDGMSVGHRERKVGKVNYGWISVRADSHQIVVTYV